MSLDIRWHQRFSNYSKSLVELKAAVELSKTRELTKLEKQGLIEWLLSFIKKMNSGMGLAHTRVHPLVNVGLR